MGVFVCMCVWCLCVSVHVCVCGVCLYLCIVWCLLSCVCVWYLCTYVHVYCGVCMCACVCICVCVHVYGCEHATVYVWKAENNFSC